MISNALVADIEIVRQRLADERPDAAQRMWWRVISGLAFLEIPGERIMSFPRGSVQCRIHLSHYRRVLMARALLTSSESQP